MTKLFKTVSEGGKDAPIIQRCSDDGRLTLRVFRKPQGLLVSRIEIVKAAGESCFDMISLFPDPQSMMKALEQDAMHHEHPLLWALIKRDIEKLNCAIKHSLNSPPTFPSNHEYSF